MLEIASENIGAKQIFCKKIKNCENRINWDKVHDAVAQNRIIVAKIGAISFRKFYYT